MHTRTHAHTHTHKHICTPTPTHPHTYTSMLTCIHMHACACIHAHMCTNVHKHAHTHARVCTHAHTGTCIHIHEHICTNPHTHMQIHTCAHTHTQAHTCARRAHARRHTCAHTRMHTHTCMYIYKGRKEKSPKGQPKEHKIKIGRKGRSLRFMWVLPDGQTGFIPGYTTFKISFHCGFMESIMKYSRSLSEFLRIPEKTPTVTIPYKVINPEIWSATSILSKNTLPLPKRVLGQPNHQIKSLLLR